MIGTLNRLKVNLEQRNLCYSISYSLKCSTTQLLKYSETSSVVKARLF